MKQAAAMLRAAAVALGLSSACSFAVDASVPTFDSVRAAFKSSDVSFVDRRGVPFQTLRVDMTERRLRWVPLADMSPALLRAIVLSEDRGFYEHSGVDWGAVAVSAWANLWNTRTRGASTLTMQLAGLLDEQLARPSGGRSMTQKIDQVLLAARLEQRWTKAQILEAYLNEVTWRGEVVGIDALSQTLFGKFPGGLDQQEAAIAAALVRGPNANAATVAERACGVLKRQQLACDGLHAMTEIALSRRGGMPMGEQLAPQFARRVLAEAGTPRAAPMRVATTIDLPLQRFAVASLGRHLAELARRHVEDGAAVVLDNATGQVLAWVGSSGRWSGAAEVDGVSARRQPGSTLKPFAYELAFERRLITPASLIDDAPVQLATGFGLYLPQNYDRDFKGWVSARTALGASLNVPAVKVGAMLGPDALFERLNAFGLELSESGGYHGYALVLGSADVTLLGLTNAYRALANGGLLSPVVTQMAARPARPARVAQADAVALVTDILADDSARMLTFGLGSSLATRGFAAVKTGTSKDMRDNWCVGFTERYTVGVWVGNASGAPMQSVSGVSGAAPIWREIVGYLHEGQPSRSPALPSGVVRQRIAFEEGREAPRDEVFLAGTEQRRIMGSALMDRGRAFGITSPRSGSVFALDPDIPRGSQKMRFEGEEGLWTLDGRVLGRGRAIDWLPWPGRHVLTLKGAAGGPAHEVRFEVRGASVKAAGG